MALQLLILLYEHWNQEPYIIYKDIKIKIELYQLVCLDLGQYHMKRVSERSKPHVNHVEFANSMFCLTQISEFL